jgi:hypothetical protein
VAPLFVPMLATSAPGPAAPLRIVTHHREVADFISGFCRVVDEEQMLVQARQARVVGTLVRFEVTLETGRVVFAGEARVIECFPARPGKSGRGLRLALLSVDEGEPRTMHRCLVMTRQRARETRMIAARGASKLPAPAELARGSTTMAQLPVMSLNPFAELSIQTLDWLVDQVFEAD